ncbi:hypothetical protein J2752_001970 [Halarchaeum rubridurum]|uniref:Uncharacterized protein n=1 Tax=Halarchaeum rubridurum TaxID=489911 RepID=A0A830G0G1_9EURY|nr:hypothetical protein [Halarchaeum rubridurum]MBP1955058.1 hypothetical protein [Halarchaeum rubridurum]GGM69279.1 hypothetical protein GCM10009017_19360 [Halarchaeum rubridurum]
MARNNLDLIDIVGMALVGFFGPMSLDAYTIKLKLFGGFDFTTVIWSGSGAEVTYATLLALGGVGWIVVANFWAGDWDIDDMEPYHIAAIVVALGIVPVYAIVPAVQNVMADYNSITLVVALVQAGFGPLLSWEG